MSQLLAGGAATMPNHPAVQEYEQTAVAKKLTVLSKRKGPANKAGVSMSSMASSFASTRELLRSETAQSFTSPLTSLNTSSSPL